MYLQIYKLCNHNLDSSIILYVIDFTVIGVSTSSLI